VDPRYCVDGSLTVGNFIIQMLVQAERSVPRETEDASALIFSTLNRFHRCSAQEIEPSK
jgi:hypothetical protein